MSPSLCDGLYAPYRCSPMNAWAYEEMEFTVCIPCMSSSVDTLPTRGAKNKAFDVQEIFVSRQADKRWENDRRFVGFDLLKSGFEFSFFACDLGCDDFANHPCFLVHTLITFKECHERCVG